MDTSIEISTQELPIWMRRARRGVDWGVLFVLGFCLAVSWALILKPGLPRTNASENHVFMASSYAEMLREGRLYPRWSAETSLGYGAPVPHFYPPGVPYAAALLQIFVTGDPVDALRILYVAGLTLAGCSVYVLVARQTGAAAGVLSGTLYVTSPYLGYVAPHVLGDLPVIWGMALVPGLLWAVSRLFVLNRPQDTLLIALITAALILTEWRYAVVGGVLTVLLIVWHVVVLRQQVRWWLVLISMVLGITLSAFYWLPALFESDFVRWQARPLALMSELSVPGLFALLQATDLNELKPLPQFTLGATGLPVVLLALWALIRRPKRTQWHGMFLLYGLAVLSLLLFVTPEQTWLFGILTLCWALSAGAIWSLSDFVPLKRRHLLLPLALVVIISLALPVWLVPRWGATFGATDSQAMIEYEELGYGVAVLPPGAPLPSTLTDNVLPNRNLLNGYQSGNVNRLVLPPRVNVDVAVLEASSHVTRSQVSTRETVEIDLLRANFPGWEAVFAGSPLDLSINPMTGLMRVNLPARSGELVVGLATTSVRTASWIVTWVSLLVLIVWGGRRYRRATPAFEDFDGLRPGSVRLMAMILIAIVVLILGVLNSAAVNLYPRPGYKLDGQFALRTRTAVGLETLAYAIDEYDYQPGEAVSLTLYWRALRPLLDNYQVQIYLQELGRDERLLLSRLRHPGGFPSQRWIPSLYVTDPYQLVLPNTLQAGEYMLVVEVYDCPATCQEEDRLVFFSEQGSVLGRALVLPFSFHVSK